MIKTDLYDFLVQDVCLDKDGRVTAEDPYLCSKKRNLEVGESLHYVRVDHIDNGVGVQALSSLPVKGPDNSIRVIHSKDFGPGDFLEGSFNYNTNLGDGFDLMEIQGRYISFIRTMDGGCFDQRFYGNDGSQEDAWVLFDNEILENKRGELTSEVSIERLEARATCDKWSHSDSVRTLWDYRQNVQFQSGKSMEVLDSFHFAHEDLSRSNNALERFLFTKEYGFTRWEAWLPKSRCVEEHAQNKDRFCEPSSGRHILDGRCDEGEREAVWGDQMWVMVDCRDSTHHRKLNRAYYPLHSEMAVGDVIYKEPSPEYPVETEQQAPNDKNTAEETSQNSDDEASTNNPIKEDVEPKEIHRFYDSSNFNKNFGYTDSSHNAPTGVAVHTQMGVSPGIFIYGPYVSDLPKGTYRAQFSLLVDVVDRNREDAIATIEVTRNQGKEIIGQRALFRSDFDKAFGLKEFSLSFKLPPNSRGVEFRIHWHGKTYLRFSGVRLKSIQ